MTFPIVGEFMQEEYIEALEKSVKGRALGIPEEGEPEIEYWG